MTVVTLLLCGFDDDVRAKAKGLADLDSLFADSQQRNDSPIEAAFYGTALILSSLIDSMTNAEREMRKKALGEQDWSDPFCKMLNYMWQVADSLEKQGRVKPMLVRMLTAVTVGRLRGLSMDEAQSLWGKEEVELLQHQIRTGHL